ncbi:MAG: hypothetical protein WAT93_09695 [Pontixanthobacter sp.]
MRGIFVSLATAAGLVAAAPAVSQSPVPALDADVALDCGVANAFFGGLLEEDDPQQSAELLDIGSAWLYLAYERMADETTFDAQVDQRSNDLLAEIEATASDDEVEAIFADISGSCLVLQSVHSAEFEAAVAALEAEK